MEDKRLKDIYQIIYKKYNDFDWIGEHIKYDITALRILKENNNITSEVDIDNKISEYDSKENQKKLNDEYQNVSSLVDFEQPNSMMLLVIYIDIVINSIEENFFEEIKLSRDTLRNIILSISLYIIFLQTYKFSDKKISKSAKKFVFERENFLIGINEIKKVCWNISQQEFEIYMKLFAFDVNNCNLNSLNNEKLFKFDDSLFILSIEKFLKFMLLNIEALYKKFCSTEDFSKYQNRKGAEFESIVYDFISPFFSTIAHTLFYYPTNDKIFEVDILGKEENTLIIIECKSGTIDLESSSTDAEVKMKIDNKVKKAYKTLENASNYVLLNSNYRFSNKNTVIEGQNKDIDVVCIHLSMYPIDSFSSNIHTLDNKYIKDVSNPKITISFEHFLSILLDTSERDYSIVEYFKKRKNYILKFPNTRFDVNELDLYHQLTNKKHKSILTDFFEEELHKSFNDDLQIIATFNNEFGEEYRPAFELTKNIDKRLLYMLLNSNLGLNKKYLSYLNNYLLEK